MNDVLIAQFNAKHEKNTIPDIRPGDTVRVTQRVKEGDKERLQMFEGLVIARKHGRGINAMITVRKIAFGVGVERIFPLHAPTITRIEVVRRAKVRRAKLYFVRHRTGRKARKMRGEILPPETGSPPREEAEEASSAETAE